MNIELHWVDQEGGECQIMLDDWFVPTAHDLGPYDLSAESSWTGKVQKIWLEFGGYTSPSSVRIGWVKLTE